MSPPPRKDGKKGNFMARLIGGASSGVLELAFFHPVDTVAKRLMASKVNVSSRAELSSVLFLEASGGTVGQKYRALFPGIGFAAGYKILQRSYKFGGQPYAREFTDNLLGDRLSKTMTSALAGSMIGIGEVALLPLDVLKIKAQTNPDVLKGRGLIELIRTERGSLYKGWQWTMARNAPGSFALFGGASFVYYNIMQLDDARDATFAQTTAASIGGAFGSLAVSSPLDVIKTRIQKASFASNEGGVAILRQLIAEEGPTALFKGLVPKFLVVGPKLVFSFTIAQYVIAQMENALAKDKNQF